MTRGIIPSTLIAWWRGLGKGRFRRRGDLRHWKKDWRPRRDETAYTRIEGYVPHGTDEWWVLLTLLWTAVIFV
jgi:hypothetical protein